MRNLPDQRLIGRMSVADDDMAEAMVEKGGDHIAQDHGEGGRIRTIEAVSAVEKVLVHRQGRHCGDLLLSHIGDRGAQARKRKIGKAAWRERVWMLGWIPGV